jgi:hypothetical protein
MKPCHNFCQFVLLDSQVLVSDTQLKNHLNTREIERVHVLIVSINGFDSDTAASKASLASRLCFCTAQFSCLCVVSVSEWLWRVRSQQWPKTHITPGKQLYVSVVRRVCFTNLEFPRNLCLWAGTHSTLLPACVTYSLGHHVGGRETPFHKVVCSGGEVFPRKGQQNALIKSSSSSSLRICSSKSELHTMLICHEKIIMVDSGLHQVMYILSPSFTFIFW